MNEPEVKVLMLKGNDGASVYYSSVQIADNAKGLSLSDLTPKADKDNPPEIGSIVMTPNGDVFAITGSSLTSAAATYDVGSKLTSIRGPQGERGPQGAGSGLTDQDREDIDAKISGLGTSLNARLDKAVGEVDDRFTKVEKNVEKNTNEINNAIKGVGFNISSASDLVAPYDSLDTLPSNSVVTYSLHIKGTVKNVPNDFPESDGASVITYSTNTSIGEVQLLTSNSRSMYYRICWGQPEIWSDWNKIASFNSLNLEPHVVVQSDIESGSDYTDLDKLVKNQVLVYAISDMSRVKKSPTNQVGTLIISNAIDNPALYGAGAVQTFVTIGNDTYRRIGWGIPVTWSDWKSFGGEVYKPTPSLAMFQNIGIIGDSYASGELIFDNAVDHYEISWGQILARKNGANAINFSVGGLTTRGWLTHERGLTLLNSSNSQDLYVCALGINDALRLGENYLGNESDIDSGADTFYGNYGKIIKAIQSKAPSAKIVISTLATSSEKMFGIPDSSIQKFNEAIGTIANHFGISLIKQADDQFFASDYYLNHMVNGHPTGPVYSEMANAFERLISKQMVDNLSYFETYKK